MKTILLIFALVGSLAFAGETNLTLTVDGITYENVRFGTIIGDSVAIIHSKGIYRVPFSKLPPEYQKQLGYDPGKTYLMPSEAATLPPATPVLVASPAITTNLESWILGDKVVKNVRMERRNPAEITVWYSGGATVVPTETLPPELHQFFHYDAATAQEFLRYREANKQLEQRNKTAQQQPAIQEQGQEQVAAAKNKKTAYDAWMQGKLHISGNVVFVQPYVGVLIEDVHVEKYVMSSQPYVSDVIEKGHHPSRRSSRSGRALIAGYPGVPSIGQSIECYVSSGGDSTYTTDFTYVTKGGQKETCTKYHYAGEPPKLE